MADKKPLSIEDLDAILKGLAASEPKPAKAKPSGAPAPRRDDWKPPEIRWELFEVHDIFEAQVCQECGQTHRAFGSRTLGYQATFGQSSPKKWLKLAPHEINKLDMGKLSYSTETYTVSVPICHHCARTVEMTQMVADILTSAKQRELF